MKFVKGVLHFLVLFVIQLFFITALEYAVFLISPGVADKLVASLAPKSEAIGHTFQYVTIFWNWFINILTRGDFGVLSSSGESISRFIWISTKITFLLILGALAFSLLMSLIIIYLKRNYGQNKIISSVLFLIQFLSSIHYIILGYIVVVEFKSGLNNFNTVYPYLVLGLGNGMLNDMVHLLETEIDKIMTSGYILAARARGGNIFKNIVAPFGISLLNVINAKMPLLLGGSFIVEFVLNIYGLGNLMLDKGINGEDYNLLLSITSIITILIVFSNLVNKIVREYLDPRPVKAL